MLCYAALSVGPSVRWSVSHQLFIDFLLYAQNFFWSIYLIDLYFYKSTTFWESGSNENDSDRRIDGQKDEQIDIIMDGDWALIRL